MPFFFFFLSVSVRIPTRLVVPVLGTLLPFVMDRWASDVAPKMHVELCFLSHELAIQWCSVTQNIKP